jgi:hypothetical protein
MGIHTGEATERDWDYFGPERLRELRSQGAAPEQAESLEHLQVQAARVLTDD